MMNLKKLAVLLFVMTGLVGAVEILPAPKELSVGNGSIGLPTSIHVDEQFLVQADALALGLAQMTGAKILVSTKWGEIRLVKKDGFGTEGYELDSTAKLTLSASSPTGIAHATATLLQILEKGEGWQVPRVVVKDSPDFGFRCFLIDMGRNPHSPETLRRVVDMMWLSKTNYLHLHLTDDQMISFPSTAFPKLLSKRAGWTIDDWRWMEKYSQARGVTLIPEFEVPGHSTLIRKHYPEVFGKTPTELATLDSAFEGITTILSELMDVFEASPYIHIGCDEAYGVKEEYQRALVNRLNAFVKSKGRKTIVWEGPRQGNGESRVDKDVIHMNWRSHEFPPQDMIAAGHPVINATWDPLYIVDHYPCTMFTAVPSEDCYNFNIKRFKHVNHGFATYAKPIQLDSTENLLGFCMPWWEGREENIFPVCRQRLGAVTARIWNGKGEASFESFLKRDARLKDILEVIRPWKGEAPTGGWSDRMEEVTPGNLAHGKPVEVSTGGSQPQFHPQRLTNGATDRFDHFLGYPTKPKPLEIVIDLGKVHEVSEIDIFEAAVGKSWESYEVSVSADRGEFVKIGKTDKSSRGESNKVTFSFDLKKARFVKISTNGCEDLTFPSFSRLCEVMVFAK
ncbi:MAG: family 20 glycosylhydrolase [Akkermansiaceae bacterium]